MILVEILGHNTNADIIPATKETIQENLLTLPCPFPHIIEINAFLNILVRLEGIPKKVKIARFQIEREAIQE